jgi:hypothetical protein
LVSDEIQINKQDDEEDIIVEYDVKGGKNDGQSSGWG